MIYLIYFVAEMNVVGREGNPDGTGAAGRASGVVGRPLRPPAAVHLSHFADILHHTFTDSCHQLELAGDLFFHLYIPIIIPPSLFFFFILLAFIFLLLFPTSRLRFLFRCDWIDHVFLCYGYACMQGSNVNEVIVNIHQTESIWLILMFKCDVINDCERIGVLFSILINIHDRIEFSEVNPRTIYWPFI